MAEIVVRCLFCSTVTSAPYNNLSVQPDEWVTKCAGIGGAGIGGAGIGGAGIGGCRSLVEWCVRNASGDVCVYMGNWVGMYDPRFKTHRSYRAAINTNVGDPTYIISYTYNPAPPTPARVTPPNPTVQAGRAISPPGRWVCINASYGCGYSDNSYLTVVAHEQTCTYHRQGQALRPTPKPTATIPMVTQEKEYPCPQCKRRLAPEQRTEKTWKCWCCETVNSLEKMGLISPQMKWGSY